jgi:peptidoglycan/xylan/chitin deacetylase (PgdA/CDA1 family)
MIMHTGKREALAQLAAACGLLRASRRLSPRARQRLLILAYHRVMPDVDESRWPFDIELISASPEQFEWQMRFVARHMRPISLGELVASVSGGAPLPERSVLVTFDDGFFDNFKYAFPLLRDSGVPGTFFISTDLIGTNIMFWFERVAHLILMVPDGEVIEVVPGRPVVVAGPFRIRRAAIKTVLSALKELREQERRAWIERLEAKYGVYADASSAHLTRPMTWDEVRAMRAGGMEFGSHGATHAVLSQLPPEALVEELERSRRALRDYANSDGRVVSYPVGGRGAFNELVIDAAKSAGFRLGVSYVSGDNPLHGFRPFHLRRQHVERITSRAWFEGLLSWPTIFS